MGLSLVAPLFHMELETYPDIVMNENKIEGCNCARESMHEQSDCPYEWQSNVKREPKVKPLNVRRRSTRNKLPSMGYKPKLGEEVELRGD